jgi:hypothetical protein
MVCAPNAAAAVDMHSLPLGVLQLSLLIQFQM